MEPKTCSVAGCGEKHAARGFCKRHHGMWLYRNRDKIICRQRAAKDKNVIKVAGVALVETTKNHYMQVDADRVDVITKYSWQYVKGYAAASIAGRPTYAHHIIVGYPLCAREVDHINGNKMDNRVVNLRLCSHNENTSNKKHRSGGTSKYKGVSWSKQRRAWIAQICSNYKQRNLGRFDSELDAARAYDAAARELHGEYAKTNFQIKGDQ